MGKSTTGPDMLDCLQYLKEISETNQASGTILLEPDGSGVGQRWRIHVLLVKRPDAMTGAGVGVSTGTLWPHREHKTFEGAVFMALAMADAEWGREVFNEILGLT